MEIERKFLVNEPPSDLARHPVDRIAQGYVALEDGVEVRVRRRSGKATLTIKQGGGLERLEEELSIGRARFDRLWPLTKGRRVEKVRHVIPHDGLTIELDVYGGALAGLVVAEVEFDSLDASAEFAAPAWFGEEVTGDERYANRSLAAGGIPEDRTVFRLAPGEGLCEGIPRVARGRLDRAIGKLEAAAAAQQGTAVHSARKGLKRARAVVRLARDELGDDTYRRENDALRETGRRLSGPRDSEVMLETLDALMERHADEIPPGTFAAFRAALAEEHRAAQRTLHESSGTLQAVVEELRRSRVRTATWSIEHDDLHALSPGFERIYRRGRKAYRAAAENPDDEALHRLRKRVKDLWYAAEMLEPAAPKRTKKLARAASDLSDVIGTDHDFAVLRETAARHAATLTGEEQDLLAGLIEKRRATLRRRALEDAARLYRLKPRAATRRIGL